MGLRVLCWILVVLSASATPAAAASYHGVEVGQREDFLPPEFDQVARGEYEARFGNELVRVFSRGALVSGIKVVPLAPATLAEAIAAHSPGAVANQFQYLLDFNQLVIGVVDVPNNIAYFTQSPVPDAAIRAVGYYNDQTALMVYRAPMPGAQAQDLVDAANRSSTTALDERPEITEQHEQARYLVEQATITATQAASRALASLQRFQSLCTGTPECNATRQTRALIVRRWAARFATEMQHAQTVYDANAPLLGFAPPYDFVNLQDFSDGFFPQVRAAVGGR